MEYGQKHDTIHDLGHAIVRSSVRRDFACITIICPSTVEENTYCPASDVSVCNIAQLKDLRNIIDVAINKAYEHLPVTKSAST